MSIEQVEFDGDYAKATGLDTAFGYLFAHIDYRKHVEREVILGKQPMMPVPWTDSTAIFEAALRQCGYEIRPVSS